MLISILLNTQEGPSAHLRGFHSTPLSFLVCVLWTPDALSSVQVPLPGNAQGCKLGGPQADLVSFPSGIALLYCCAQCLRNHVLAVVGVASLSRRPHYALTLTLVRLTKPWSWFPYFCFKQAWVRGWKGFLPGQRKDSQTLDCSWPTLTLNAGFQKVRFSVCSRAHRGRTTVRVVEGSSQLLIYRRLLECCRLSFLSSGHDCMLVKR